MPGSIFIEEYSPKSFVVRGDTRDHKESLKALGGKWNSGLTDKQSGDKFGAWLFWNDKQKEIKDWIDKGCKNVDSEMPKTKVSIETPDKLEAKVDLLLKMMESLCKHQGLEFSRSGSVVQRKLEPEIGSDDDEPVVVKPKRLLGR
jgi:hypothetical protein